MRLIRIAALALSCLGTPLLAQVTNTTDLPTTWDLFAGGSLLHSDKLNTGGAAYGWDVSISERPYRSHPWIGGTIEGSGNYYSKSVQTSGITVTDSYDSYTFMGGPFVTFRTHHLDPFARVLLGTVIQQTGVSAAGQNNTGTLKNFGYDFGGGVDVPLGRRFALRGQGDFIRVRYSSSESANAVRAAAGFVVKF